MLVSHSVVVIVEVDFLWNRTVDSLKTSFHPLLWTSGIAEKQNLIWGMASSLSMPRNCRGVKSDTLGKQWEIWKCPMGVKLLL